MVGILPFGLDGIYLCLSNVSFVCVPEEHYVWIFFTRLRSVDTAMLFRFFSGRLLTSQQKCIFFCLRFIFSRRLVIVFISMAVWNPDISDSVYLKSEQCLQHINEWKKIETQCCSVAHRQVSHRTKLIDLFSTITDLTMDFYV